jgi:hypothetical protein
MRVELTLVDREVQVESDSDSTSPAINAEKLIPYRLSHRADDRYSVANVLVRAEQLNREPNGSRYQAEAFLNNGYRQVRSPELERLRSKQSASVGFLRPPSGKTLL